jgi:hypothetical protein
MYPNCDFWYENIPSGSPALMAFHRSSRDARICTYICTFGMSLSNSKKEKLWLQKKKNFARKFLPEHYVSLSPSFSALMRMKMRVRHFWKIRSSHWLQVIDMNSGRCKRIPLFSNSRDRCYDFKNNFAKKSAKNWRFRLKTELNYATIWSWHCFLRKKPPIFSPRIGKNRRKL